MCRLASDKLKPIVRQESVSNRVKMLLVPGPDIMRTAWRNAVKPRMPEPVKSAFLQSGLRAMANFPSGTCDFQGHEIGWQTRVSGRGWSKRGDKEEEEAREGRGSERANESGREGEREGRREEGRQGGREEG